MTFPSNLIEDAVSAFSSLPGVGRKTALRYVLHMLKQDAEQVKIFATQINDMRTKIKYCSICHNVADDDTCGICASASRQKHIVCVVENIRDLLAIEGTQQYNGVYHVLGGLISPLDGIGPDQINLNSLFARIENEQIEEIILALSANIPGETTAYYLQKNLPNNNIAVTTISRGVAFGADLEFTDELTLGRSIQNRLKLAVDR